MEAPPHQQSPEWDWLNWEGDEAGDIFEVASMGLPTFLKDVSGTEDADDNQDVPLDARLARGDIQSHILDNQGSGEIPNVNPLELEWGSMAGITPPELLVSGDSGWSPGSGSSSFNSPLTTWESPYLSPNLLLGQSPLPAFPFSFPPSNSPYAVCRVNGFPICASPSTATEIPCHLPDPLPGTSSLQEFPHGCPSNMSLYAVPGLAPYDVSLDRPAALSGQAGAQEPRWQATATNRSPALQGHPARLSARKRRQQTRPVGCPICGKGHSYWDQVKRHIVSNHPERAAEFQLSTDPFECRWCGKSYKRKDRLLRHLTAKHGRPKGRKKRGQ